ncbi:MAG TPA: DUF4124 domain-containing protein [Xanthomonadales bacterium]|nr:DUF4124 domain-containing protein [Xanthomonadales bacterium]
MTPLIAALMLLSADATEVHRCVGSDGVPRYQDRPCASGESQQHLQLKAPLAAPPATTAAPAASSAVPIQAPQKDLDSAPEPQSWRCEVDNGEVFYRHDGCPEVISEPLWLNMPDRSGYSTYMQVRAQQVARNFACRQIDRGGRFGAERDQRASPYEKLSGRDLCR